MRWLNRTHASGGEKQTYETSAAWFGSPEELKPSHRQMPLVLTRVPRVVAVRPRQLRLEAVAQVEERPRQDDYIIHATMEDHHLAGVAEACGDEEKEEV